SYDDSYGGDSNGDGAASSPAVGDWGYIQYSNPANVLHDVVVRYGGRQMSYNSYYGYWQDTATQMIWATGSAIGTLEIRNCVIEKAYNTEIYVDSTQSLNIHDNTLRTCQTAVSLAGSGNVTVTN